MLSVDVMLNSRWPSSDHWLTAFKNSSLKFWSGAPRNSITEADYTDSTEKNPRRLEYQRLFIIGEKKKILSCNPKLSFSNTFSPQVYHGCTWPSTAEFFFFFFFFTIRLLWFSFYYSLTLYGKLKTNLPTVSVYPLDIDK